MRERERERERGRGRCTYLAALTGTCDYATRGPWTLRQHVHDDKCMGSINYTLDYLNIVHPRLYTNESVMCDRVRSVASLYAKECHVQ